MMILYRTWTRELVNTVTLSREQLSSPEFSLPRKLALSLPLPFPFSFCLFIFHVQPRAVSRLVIDFSFLLHFSLFSFFFVILEIIWKEIEFDFRNFLWSFEAIKKFVDNL